MTFTAERHIWSGADRPHWEVVHLEAKDWGEADRICKAQELQRCGELIEVIPAPELNEFTRKIQDQRDRDWVDQA